MTFDFVCDSGGSSMSAKSSFLRGVYGVDPDPVLSKSKYDFYRKQREQWTKIRRRAEQILDREIAKKEAQRSRRVG